MVTRRADVQTTTCLLFANAMQAKTTKNVYPNSEKQFYRNFRKNHPENFITCCTIHNRLVKASTTRDRTMFCWWIGVWVGIPALRPKLINEILNKHELQIFIKNLLTKKIIKENWKAQRGVVFIPLLYFSFFGICYLISSLPRVLLRDPNKLRESGAFTGLGHAEHPFRVYSDFTSFSADFLYSIDI